MRRLALSVLAACGLAFVSACAGGTGFAGGGAGDSVDAVVFQNGSSQTNDFFVAPGGTSPALVSAIGTKNSGITQTVVPDANFIWKARYVTSSTDQYANYVVGPAPSTFKQCPLPTSALRPIPILVRGGTGAASTLYNGFTQLGPQTPAREVYVGPAPGMTAPYCLVLEADHVGGSDNAIGQVLVVVSSSP